MSKLIIAEKPSVAKSIASALGASSRADGFYEGSGLLVSWCVGHLVSPMDAGGYDERFKKWRYDDLPILPEPFRYVLAPGKEDAFENLRALMNRPDVDTIVNACDAGREGELIFRLMYEMASCRKSVLRLWISSMEDSAIREGFSGLRPGADYEALYQSALCRQKADWLVGINATRLFSVLYHRTLNVGRVQTPTLAMLAERDAKITLFHKEKYHLLRLTLDGAEAVSEKFTDSAAAEQAAAMCKGATVTCTSVTKEQKKEQPPKLYDLTTLQREANRLYGYTAKQTLDYAQSLYEKKLLTYPRTDSNYLTDDMADILPERVGMLRAFEEKAVNILLANGLNIDGRIINNAKVSDHHAIIPTENIGSAVNMELTPDEKQILHLVIRRLLEALSPQYEYLDIEYIFDICGETFKLKQKKPVSLGWKALCPDDIEIPPEISYSENDTFNADDISITEGESKPPKCYTESSLLKAMENIDRRIEDKELSGYVSERGLGTPATRAAIIEKILADGYAERKNKVISATEMGIKMINFVPPEIKSVEMTAAMELQLAAIENGTASADEVISSITEKIKAIIEAEKHKGHTPVVKPKTVQRAPIGKCPKCGGNVYKFVRENTSIYYCENAPKSCYFRVYEDDYFFTSKGAKLTEPMMKNLLLHGEVKVSDFKSEKTGSTYTAVVSLADRTDKNGNAKIGFTMRFEDKTKR